MLSMPQFIMFGIWFISSVRAVVINGGDGEGAGGGGGGVAAAEEGGWTAAVAAAPSPRTPAAAIAGILPTDHPAVAAAIVTRARLTTIRRRVSFVTDGGCLACQRLTD